MKKNTEENWTTQIEVNKSIFDVNFRELWDYRDLLWLFVRRDFVAFYKQTIFGPLWFFVQPIFTTLMYVFVFSNLAQLSTDRLPPALFYLVGITAWGYFSDCILKTSTVFRDNSGIFGKVYFPRLIMPISIIFSNLIRFGVQFILLLITMTYLYFINKGFTVTPFVFLMPLFIFFLGIQGLGLGMIVSALTTKYRDLALLLSFGIQLLMYATTVIYPLSMLSGYKKLIVSYIPITPIIEGMRLALLGRGEFNFYSMGYLATISSCILISGILFFNKVEKNFIDTI